MKNMLLTIFTPTYNRAHLLSNVYNSLLAQTDKNFEWIIVDDGSSDDTQVVIKGLINEGLVDIRYFYQQNAGKHIAVNNGVKKAKGELFLILDSDDELTNDAVSSVNNEFERMDASFGGVVFNKLYMDGRLIGNTFSQQYIDETIIDFRFRRKVGGDKLEVFKTKLLKQYPFPENGERFCPEALVWNRIGSKVKFRFVNQGIYRAEYLPGGLTEKIIKIRKENPRNSATYYSELTKYNIPVPEKIKAGINYWRFAIYDKNTSILKKITGINPFLSLIGLPLGLVYALSEKSK